MSARCLVLILLALCTSTPGAAEDARAVLERIGFDQHLDARLPLDLPFKDEAGAPVMLQKYFRGKPVILQLVYHACPMLCGAGETGLVNCFRAMPYRVGKDFEVLTISFDPQETTALSVAKKAEYLHAYGHPEAGEGWHFLTGDADAIKDLTAATGFRYAFDAAAKQYAHPSGIVLLTPEGRISRYYFGIEYYPRDLDLGLVEASQNKIGTLSDQALLYCYRYDPLTGKYGLAVTNLLKFGGLATVLALGTFIALMLRRDARLKKNLSAGRA